MLNQLMYHPTIEKVLSTFLHPIIDLVATHLRPLAMVVVVLPLSVLLRVYFTVSEYLQVNYLSTPHFHGDRVLRVQKQVQTRNSLPNNQKKLMCTARAPWQNLSTRFADYKKDSNCIFVGDFNNILDLDTVNMTLRVEPLAQVGEITRFLVQRGYMLATTLEIEEATIGGLAMAVGMTTASHKYGLLQETVEEYEVVLGDGRIVRATRDAHTDLYYALPWSHGSLGLLVGLKLQIIPVKKYVRLTYHPFYKMQQYTSKIRQLALEDKSLSADFVEATVFTQDSAVVMEARFDDGADAGTGTPVNNISWWWKPWFYKHVESMLENGSTLPVVELIPTYEYIFRHNRAIFWTLRDQLPEYIGNHPLFRLVFGWMCPPYVQFLKLPATKKIRKEMQTQRVYQDIVLPLSAMEDSIKLAESVFGISPVLIYPSRIIDHGPGKRGTFPVPRDQDIITTPNNAQFPRDAMYYDLGVYGIPREVVNGDSYDAIGSARVFEAFTRSVRGAPFLYADTFMTRKEFNEMFNLELYDKVRKTYGAEGCFPHVYDKTTSVK